MKACRTVKLHVDMQPMGVNESARPTEHQVENFRGNRPVILNLFFSRMILRAYGRMDTWSLSRKAWKGLNI